MTPVATLRLQLRKAGYHPVPCEGKAVYMNGWENKFDSSDDEIRLWDQVWHLARNTGVLAKFTPGLDIDIMDAAAADAVEALAREHFEERGNILIRFGLPPKRLVPLRTDEPFKKLARVFTAPNGQNHKIEVLGSGQQWIALGIHPDTHCPYGWHGGELTTTPREDLPYVRADDMENFLNAAADLLLKEFNYTVAAEPPAGNGPDAPPADWGWLIENIKAGRSLHDSLRNLAAKLAKAGTHPGAIVNQLRAMMEASDTPHDDRFRKRMREIPGLVDSAIEKFAAPEAAPAPDPKSLPEVHKTFRKWFGDDYDIDVINAVLAAAASERLTGDPLWLLVISGPGNAKTETVQALSGAGAHVTSTITSEGALLSATPRREKSKQATGGLLRKIGDRGVLVIKDVTSILSADRNTRATVLAAIREIYDGRWERNVGTDGGRTLTWTGRITVVGAVTTAWDAAHAVVSAMGDRFVIIRSNSRIGRTKSASKAIRNTGDEIAMRKELAQVVGGLISNASKDEYQFSDAEIDRLVKAADIVTSARTGVERDYKGDVIDAHAPEMPTRYSKQLAQLVRGAVVIGISAADALCLAIRCARDSIPPVRREILLDIAANPSSLPRDVHRRIGRPRSTVRRELEALYMLRLLQCDETDEEHGGKMRTLLHYSLAVDFDRDTLLAMTRGPEM
jgi:Bifunctional DNA primase/polymerase, N-terminal